MVSNCLWMVANVEVSLPGDGEPWMPRALVERRVLGGEIHPMSRLRTAEDSIEAVLDHLSFLELYLPEVEVRVASEPQPARTRLTCA